jgi:hypothetical protein
MVGQGIVRTHHTVKFKVIVDLYVLSRFLHHACGVIVHSEKRLGVLLREIICICVGFDTVFHKPLVEDIGGII